jgi:hypothetical protein
MMSARRATFPRAAIDIVPDEAAALAALKAASGRCHSGSSLRVKPRSHCSASPIDLLTDMPLYAI